MKQTASGWQSAHELAVSSLAVVLTVKRSNRALPFMAERRKTQRERLSASEAASRRAALSQAPDGNHGGYFSGVKNHD